MISNEDKKDVARHMGSKMASTVAKVTKDTGSTKVKGAALKRRLEGLENFSGVDTTHKNNSERFRTVKVKAKDSTPHRYHLSEVKGYGNAKYLGGNSTY